MRQENRIDYVEIPVTDLAKAKAKEVFEFPGGRRFHFVDPTGTEYAIWSEVS